MKHFLSITFVTLLAAAPVALAQKWEVGVGGGGSFSTSQTIKNAIGDANGGFSPGLAVSAWLGNNSNGTISGELRYDYEHTNLKLSSGGTNVSFGAMTNAIHYDVVLHFAPSESHIRPFVAAGAGVKSFTGTGQEQEFQPLSNIALLTKTSQIEPLVGSKRTTSSVPSPRTSSHRRQAPLSAVGCRTSWLWRASASRSN
jgi:hypothetical protein